MNVQIRPFEDRDESAVIDLWETVFPDDPPWNNPADVIARKRQVQSELFLVATINERLVGTVIAGYDGVRGWVHKLATHPDNQRRGIANQLMKAAEDGLSRLGCPKLNIQVRASNANVVKFYEAAGYVIEDRISLGKRLR